MNSEEIKLIVSLIDVALKTAGLQFYQGDNAPILKSVLEKLQVMENNNTKKDGDNGNV